MSVRDTASVDTDLGKRKSVIDGDNSRGTTRR